MVELSNGCICCTLREDLLTSLASLAAERRFDHVRRYRSRPSGLWARCATLALPSPPALAAHTHHPQWPPRPSPTVAAASPLCGQVLVESSGISEPLPVAETFTFVDAATGLSLSDVASLHNLVTVIDAASLFEQLGTVDMLADRGWQATEGDGRSVAQLLCDQLEFADVLVLNKIDLVSETQLLTVETLLRKINPTAEIQRTLHSKLDPAELLGVTARFKLAKAEEHPQWLAEARKHEHTPETVEYGISSFIYRAQRPFHPGRLHAALCSRPRTGALGRLLRLKGVAWLATRYSHQAHAALAGTQFSMLEGPLWGEDVGSAGGLRPNLASNLADVSGDAGGGLQSLLGATLLDGDGKAQVALSMAVAGAPLVALYFSAHWCSPCRKFTPKLVAFVEELEEEGVRLPIVFGSSDRNEAAFQKYFSSMTNFHAFPHGDARIEALKQKYAVTGVPWLVVLDAAGNLVVSEASLDVQQGPQAYHMWLTKAKVAPVADDAPACASALDGCAAKCAADTEHGDRHTELVCIGQDLDHAAAEAALHLCLLTDEEMAAGKERWAELPDAFRTAWDGEALRLAGREGDPGHGHPGSAVHHVQDVDATLLALTPPPPSAKATAKMVVVQQPTGLAKIKGSNVQLVVWRRPSVPHFVVALSDPSIAPSELPAFEGLVASTGAAQAVQQKLRSQTKV